MPDTLLCHKCEHPRERFSKCGAPGCECECEHPEAPSPETRRLGENQPFSRGYRDALDKFAPDATRHGMQYVEEFSNYLNGYDAGSPPGIDVSRKNRDTLLQTWIAHRSGKKCATCRHALGGDGQCRVRECLCSCQGRAEVMATPMVEHPTHYNTSKIEVWDAIVAWDLDFLTGSAIKYIARAGKKDPAKHIEDLKKAREFIDKAIAVEEEKRSD